MTIREQEEDNVIFKALADPSRRFLLDLLQASDGRSLSELCEHLDMSRFGVMKHLNILEEAGLITTQKAGREKLHYLNPAPITRIYNRWVSKYAEPWAMHLNHLKTDLERESMQEKHVYQIWIRTSPERLWQAITDPEKTVQFLYQSRVLSDWQIGGEVRYMNEQGETTAIGELEAFDPPRKLSYTWKLLAVPETAAEPPSRITYDIAAKDNKPGVCTLTVTHDRLEQSPETYRFVGNGWPGVMSNLKTFLETGTPLL
ncbi:ArsR/SmtB family transcription factor [Paenibacillaceae bacterium WGS1546]|uniref:ArsR/SmtB family transcription factor n=1 Tax=Cohnella sp. WGS1546 TaxID=3366810 RepID=UPI00372D62BF